MKPKVLLSEDINPEGKKLLDGKAEIIIAPDTSKETALHLVRDVTGIILRANTAIDAEIIANAPRLRVIARTGAGVDNIDILAATEKGIYVCNFPGMINQSVAEHTMTMIMAVSRHVIHMHSAVKSGMWQERFSPFQAEVEGKSLGVIGMGRIGSLVAKKCRNGLGMNILAYDPYVSGSMKDTGIVFTERLEELFQQSDYITIHVPNLPETQGMVSRVLLGMMKESAYLINTSRGQVIDESALIHALENKAIRGAALDVFSQEPLPQNHPLNLLDNVILSPHSAGSTWESNVRIAKAAAQAVLEVIEGRRPGNVYNHI